MSRWARLLLLAVLLLVLAGGSGLGVHWLGQSLIVDSDQVQRSAALAESVQPGTTLGQTFVARHAGLAGLELYLVPAQSEPASLTLRLRASSPSSPAIRTATLSALAGATPGFYRFAFEPLTDSHNQSYYATVEGHSGSVQLQMAAGDTYLHGAAYREGEPLDAQLSFRLVYASGAAFVGLLAAIPGWLALLGIAVLAFALPGWTLMVWLWPTRDLGWGETLGLAAGIGLAFYPLMMLWTNLVGLNLGRWYAWLAILAGAITLGWRLRKARPKALCRALAQWSRSEQRWPDVALVLALSVILLVRFLAVRSLEAPMWGDGYQHTLITQLLVDHGGLFENWAPYADLDRFTYHFGFHAAAAVVHWLSGLPVMESTLLAGQLLNGLAVLAIYPVATRVTRNRWGGVWAVVLAGLLAPMPMSYTNWGRYTQLAGLAVLPAASYATITAVRGRRVEWRPILLAVLLAGGLALTHYRVFIFYGLIALAWLMVTLGDAGRRQTLARSACIGAGIAIVCLPWLLRTFEGNLPLLAERRLTTLPSQLGSFARAYNAVGPLDSYLSPGWWLTSVVGLGLGLWQRRRGVLLTGLSYSLLLVAANLDWLSLPGSGIITNFDVLIAAYLPAALLTGFLGVQLLPALTSRKWLAVAAAAALAGLSAWGAYARLGDLHPDRHALVTYPDVRAAEWIRKHTPADAHFAINSFRAYGGSLVVGSDAGWWLPILASRQTTVPPLTYGTELPADSAYRQQVLSLGIAIQERGLHDLDTLDLARRQGITHVYLGQRQGSVNSSGAGVIEPGKLVQSPHFQPVYHQDRVWVFEIVP